VHLQMTLRDSLSNPAIKKRIPIVHDGDHGGDDLITSLIALARTDVFNLLGITTCFGNIPVEVATNNACLALDFKPDSGVSVYQGACKPWKSTSRVGDNAFGSNGLGGVEMPSPTTTPASISTLDWLIELLGNAEQPVTLCPTGPLTNIAQLLDTRPELKPKIASIVAMGGCLKPQAPHGRLGNITPFAEFNFYMDAEAADFVLQSGVPVVVFPLDVTQQLVFTPSRQQIARSLLGPGMGEKLVQIMRAAEELDSHHFDLDGGVFHDETVLLYLLEPDLFSGRQLNLRVLTDADSEHYGQLVESSDASASESKMLLIETLLDSDRAFEMILDALKIILKQ
jgi:purine nucleosidase